MLGEYTRMIKVNHVERTHLKLVLKFTGSVGTQNVIPSVHRTCFTCTSLCSLHHTYKIKGSPLKFWTGIPRS